MSPASRDPVPEYLQEDDITEECRALVPSLPSEIGWGSTRLYLYQGFWYPILPLNGIILAQRHFQALNSDIILATTPKSGTTWLKAMMFSLLHRSQYSKNETGLEQHAMHSSNPHDLVPFLEVNPKLYLNDPNHDAPFLNPPRLFSTHIAYASLPESVKESNCKLVYLCRNPKDTFVSLWHFAAKLTPKDMTTASLEDAFEGFCRGLSIAGPYWDHVLGYHTISKDIPDKVMFLTYEEIKENPRKHLKRLAEFMNCPLSNEEEDSGCIDDILGLCSFDRLSKLEVNQSGKVGFGVENKWFFRKGEVGDSVNNLSPEMVERLDRITQEKFHESTLEF